MVAVESFRKRTRLLSNRKLLGRSQRHHIPVTGFVIKKRVEALGRHGHGILKSWTSRASISEITRTPIPISYSLSLEK